MVELKENVVNERFIEAQIGVLLVPDTQDLVATGTISDIEDGYLLLTYLGLHSLFSISATKEKILIKFCSRKR